MVPLLLIGLYTGARASAILEASPYRGTGRAFVDLERGLYYRRADGAAETKKRRPPVPLPPRLLAHMRRWVRKGLINTHFVEWGGKPVKSVKRSFQTAVEVAGLEGHVIPHTLRHTAVTWLLLNGVSIWDASAFTGMSPEMVSEVYGHHSPEFLKAAVEGIGRKPNVGPGA